MKNRTVEAAAHGQILDRRKVQAARVTQLGIGNIG